MEEERRREGMGWRGAGGGGREDRDGIERMRKTKGSRGRGVVRKGSERREG